MPKSPSEFQAALYRIDYKDDSEKVMDIKKLRMLCDRAAYSLARNKWAVSPAFLSDRVQLAISMSPSEA